MAENIAGVESVESMGEVRREVIEAVRALHRRRSLVVLGASTSTNHGTSLVEDFRVFVRPPHEEHAPMSEGSKGAERVRALLNACMGSWVTMLPPEGRVQDFTVGTSGGLALGGVHYSEALVTDSLFVRPRKLDTQDVSDVPYDPSPIGTYEINGPFSMLVRTIIHPVPSSRYMQMLLGESDPFPPTYARRIYLAPPIATEPEERPVDYTPRKFGRSLIPLSGIE